MAAARDREPRVCVETPIAPILLRAVIVVICVIHRIALQTPRSTDLADPVAVSAPLQRRGKPTEADFGRLQTCVRSCMCRLSPKRRRVL